MATLGELAYKQANEKGDESDLIINSGWLADTIDLSKGQINMKVNDKNILNLTNNGVQTQNNVHNTGSIQRERRQYFQADNLQKEFFIPSSMVTPIPSQLPWTGVLNMIQKLAAFSAQISSLLSFRW